MRGTGSETPIPLWLRDISAETSVLMLKTAYHLVHEN